MTKNDAKVIGAMANSASANVAAERVAFRTCPLCEAGCGLEISVKGSEVVRIRGDMNDVFSKGYICPKGSTLKQLDRKSTRLNSSHRT